MGALVAGSRNRNMLRPGVLEQSPAGYLAHAATRPSDTMGNTPQSVTYAPADGVLGDGVCVGGHFGAA